jgi:nondiscriminating glutamyl-tRNA synthetase
MTKSDDVRVRFAPSPTGYLHVGGARTALFNYLYAQKMNGKFILRIEDTDQARSTDESLKVIVNDLKWLGMDWDEGIHPETLADMGPHASYYQSRRQDIYAKYAAELIHSGRAYYCFLTEDEIDAQRALAEKSSRPHQTLSPYEEWSYEQAKAHMEKTGVKGVVRFKTKHLKKDYILKDLVRGEVKFPSDMVGDFVLLRSDGMPVYNFCCVVDDYLMKITHVLRGEEHLPNTLRQMMIYEGLGWKMPEFGHMSLLLNDERQKLSKRQGSVACSDFREQGYLPEALINFISLLGWSSPEGKEILSLKELIQQFSLDRLHVAGAVFDRVKLKWMNSVHLRALPHADLWNRIEPFLVAEGLIDIPEDFDWRDRSLSLFKSSMETLKDAVELYKPISDRHFVIHEESAEALAWPSTKSVVEEWCRGLKEISTEYLTEAEFTTLQSGIQTKLGVKGKNLFMPIRVCVIGKPHGAELKILIPLLKKSSMIQRAQQVQGKL